MKISIIGTGYVGAVTGACRADTVNPDNNPYGRFRTLICEEELKSISNITSIQ